MPFYLFPPIGGFGNPSQPWVTPTQITNTPLIAHKGQAHLLEASPIDFNEVLSFRAYGPAGGLDRPSWFISGQRVVINPAATLSRSSKTVDTPSDTWIPGLLQPTLNYGRSLWNSADPMQISSPASGVIDLQDNKGQLEYLLDYSWDAAPITVRRGSENALFSTYKDVGKFYGANIIGDMDKKTIRLRDASWKLNVLLHNNYYTGEGGRNGGAALTNVWKPYAVGWNKNIPPIQVDIPRQIFQWSFTSSEALMDFRHGGTSLTPTGVDYLTYEELADAVDTGAIPVGFYSTCLAESMAAVNIDITRSIRVDVKGDNSIQSGHPAPTDRAAIVRRIATAFGSTTLDDVTEIDFTSFNVMLQEHSSVCGFFWDREINKDQALNEVLSGILGFWYVSSLGRLSVGFARIPEQSDSVMDLAFQSYGMGKITMTDFIPPRANTQIGWQRNYGPETRDQLSPGIDETLAVILGRDSGYESAGDSSIVAFYPTAPTVKLQGNFWSQDDARAEAIRQATLFNKPRRRYRWTMEIDAFADLLNKVVNVTGVNRLFLGSEKPLLCVMMDSRGFGNVTTEWWG